MIDYLVHFQNIELSKLFSACIVFLMFSAFVIFNFYLLGIPMYKAF